MSQASSPAEQEPALTRIVRTIEETEYSLDGQPLGSSRQTVHATEPGVIGHMDLTARDDALQNIDGELNRAWERLSSTGSISVGLGAAALLIVVLGETEDQFGIDPTQTRTIGAILALVSAITGYLTYRSYRDHYQPARHRDRFVKNVSIVEPALAVTDGQE